MNEGCLTKIIQSEGIIKENDTPLIYSKHYSSYNYIIIKLVCYQHTQHYYQIQSTTYLTYFIKIHCQMSKY